MLRPPGVSRNWEDNNMWAQAQLIAYSQIRCYEEDEEMLNLYRAMGAKV